MIVPSLLNAGRSLDRDSVVVSARTPSSSREEQRIALALRDGHGHELLVEETVLGGLGRALVGPGTEGVLLLAREPVPLVVAVGREPHRDLVESAEQSVVRHGVDDCRVAVLHAAAHLGEEVWGVRHRLHATGDDDLELSGADQLVGQGDGVQAGQTDLVDGDRGDVHRDAALDRRLSRAELPGAGLQDLAEDHVVDLLTRDAGPLQGRLDGEATEVGSREVLEGAKQSACRRTRSGNDDGRVRSHGEEPPESRPRGALPVRRGGRPMGVLPRYRDVTANLAGGILVITRIDHVGVAVADLDEAKAFYARTFGLVTVHEEVNEEQGVREAMLAPGPDVDGPGARLQLLAPLSPTSTIAAFLDRRGPGLQQMAWTVDDIDATCADLRTKGVRLLFDEPRRGTAGSRINFVHPKDAGGVLVELVEPASP